MHAYKNALYIYGQSSIFVCWQFLLSSMREHHNHWLRTDSRTAAMQLQSIVIRWLIYCYLGHREPPPAPPAPPLPSLPLSPTLDGELLLSLTLRRGRGSSLIRIAAPSCCCNSFYWRYSSCNNMLSLHLLLLCETRVGCRLSGDLLRVPRRLISRERVVLLWCLLCLPQRERRRGQTEKQTRLDRHRQEQQAHRHTQKNNGSSKLSLKNLCEWCMDDSRWVDESSNEPGNVTRIMVFFYFIFCIMVCMTQITVNVYEVRTKNGYVWCLFDFLTHIPV